jgi:hypothetical protein
VLCHMKLNLKPVQVSSVAENVGVGVHFNAFVPWQDKVKHIV